MLSQDAETSWMTRSKSLFLARFNPSSTNLTCGESNYAFYPVFPADSLMLAPRPKLQASKMPLQRPNDPDTLPITLFMLVHEIDLLNRMQQHRP